MSKCLVTKLRAIVNNPSLPKLGEMRINFGSVSTPSKITNGLKMTFSEDTILTIVGEGSFADESLTPTTRSVEFEANVTKAFYVTSGSVVSVPNKFAVKTIEITATGKAPNITFDFEDLKQNTILTKISLTGIGTKIDTAWLTNKPLLSYLNAEGGILYGELSNLQPNVLTDLSLGSCKDIVGTTVQLGALSKKMKNIGASSSSISGTMEEFVEALADVQNTSNISIYHTGVMFFHGSVNPNPATISRSGDTIVVKNNSTTFGTYTISTRTWTYS